MYATLWEFRVRPGSEAEFERHCRPAGSWVALFRAAPDFLETLLLRDRPGPQRFLTLDRWRSEAGYRSFRRDFAAQYAGLDRTCEALMSEERCLGELGD